ncbi:helix-turn-helix domain-containing protein [Gordonia malaquae]|uniref:helix-turn-helix domain-containing protein n=1 Tax=Gordonia malaquae TaxID=410332 RepID=UPI0030FE60F6
MARPRNTNPASRLSMHENAGIAMVVAERRRALGLTQEMLADLADVSRSTVQALEYGSPSVRLGALTAVADVLGLAVDVRPKGDGR